MNSNKTIYSLCNNAVTDVTKTGVRALASHTRGAKYQDRTRNYNRTAHLYNPIKGKQILPSTNSCDSAEASNGRIASMMNFVAISLLETRCLDSNANNI